MLVEADVPDELFTCPSMVAVIGYKMKTYGRRKWLFQVGKFAIATYDCYVNTM